VLGIDNFNDYYPVSLKRARAAELANANIHIVHGDINDADLLSHLLAVRHKSAEPQTHLFMVYLSHKACRTCSCHL
jgi:hypothetical protein